MLSWMLYACGTALLLGIAARSLETAVRQRGWPTRWLWLVSLLSSVLLPLFALRRSDSDLSDSAIQDASAAGEWSPSTDYVRLEWTDRVEQMQRAIPPSIDADLWLLSAWGLASAVVAACLLLSYRGLQHHSRGWRPRKVDGRRVWISPDSGPAVFGVIRSRIVLPEWLLELGAVDRALVLAHEEEHVNAGDPSLLGAALLLLVAFPWNLSLWWQWRRLRQAVEIDCDLRVLRRGLNARAYSRVLVDVIERGVVNRFSVAALSGSPSFLERRIRHMLTPIPTRWWTRAAGAALVAAGCVLTACQIEQPDGLTIPGSGATAAKSTASSPVRRPVDGVAAVERAIQHYFPEVLTKGADGDTAHIYFVTNTRGEIEHAKMANGIRDDGNMLKFAEKVFPGLGTKQFRKPEIGALITRAGSLGPDAIEVVYWQHQVEGMPTGPYFFFDKLDLPGKQQLRAILEQYHPQTLTTGVQEGEHVWFLVSDQNQVLKTGRAMISNGKDARSLLEARYPGVRTGNVGFSRLVETRDGRSIPVAWAWVKRHSALP